MIGSYLLIINLITFWLMGYDKRQSIKQSKRIPEVVLFCLASLGGCYGFLIGMIFFHHKTRKLYFKTSAIGFVLLWTNVLILLGKR